MGFSKVFFTVAILVCLGLVVFSLLMPTYRVYVIDADSVKKLYSSDTTAWTGHIVNLNNESAVEKMGNAEKILSLNNRLDDFRIYTGIIITLVLAILAGAYIRNESTVNQFLQENFDDYLNKINEKNEEAIELVSKIQASEKAAKAAHQRINQLSETDQQVNDDPGEPAA